MTSLPADNRIYADNSLTIGKTPPLGKPLVCLWLSSPPTAR